MRGEKEIMSLAQAAIAQLNLPKNAAKGDWKEELDMQLFIWVEEETKELLDAFSDYCGDQCDDNLQKVREEAGDVVNVVMMLADKCGALEMSDNES